jgi:hypothetical protein
MKPGSLIVDYFGAIFFHAYEWAFSVRGMMSLPWQIECRAMQIRADLLQSVGCLDSELI